MISKQRISLNRFTITNESPKFKETVKEVVDLYSKNISPILIEIEEFGINKGVKAYSIDWVSLDYLESPRKGNTLKVTESVIRITTFYRYDTINVYHQEEVYLYSQIKRITLYYPY